MRTSFMAVIAMVSALVASGCATAPSADQLAKADYGPPVSAQDFQTAVKTHMSSLLFDPYTAVYSDWTPPQKGWWGHGFGQFSFGWVGSFTLNAKNRFGGYVGQKRYNAAVNRGTVVGIAEVFP